MTAFQDRERAFEAKFAHDKEFRFLTLARRDKLLAHWSTERLGLSGQARADLTASVLALRDGAGHDEALLTHVAATRSSHGDGAPRTEPAAVLNRCAAQARQQLLDSPMLHDA